MAEAPDQLNSHRHGMTLGHRTHPHDFERRVRAARGCGHLHPAGLARRLSQIEIDTSDRDVVRRAGDCHSHHTRTARHG